MTLLKTPALVALAAAALLASAGAAAAQTPQAAAPASMAGCADDIRHNATRDPVEFQSGGHTIRGYIYKPHTSNGAGVVLLHGFRGLSADAPVFDPHAIQLASRGYTVLVPSFFDARPWRDRKTGQDMRAWSMVGADGLKYVAGLPGIDPQRVGLWGFSLGGYLATDGALAEGSGAALAIGVNAGTDVWGEPSRGRREIPILMIHGRSDPSISPSSMRDLAGNLRLRGATVDIEMIEANQHLLDTPTWCNVFALSRRFMDSHLLPAAAAAAPAPATTPAG